MTDRSGFSVDDKYRTLGRRALMASGVTTPYLMYQLAQTVPAGCMSDAYGAGVRDARLAAEHGPLAAAAPDGAWFCALLWPEGVYLGALLLAVAAFVSLSAWAWYHPDGDGGA